jgi:NTE family protein
MRKDFKPDFILGSAVSNNPRKPDEGDLIMQVQNMIMNRIDYSIDKKEGLLIHFQMNVNTFNFSRVDELVQLGYDSTMKHIDEIKARIKRRVTAGEVAEKRKQFTGRFPELKFQSVDVQGVDSLQKKYVEQVFHYKNDVFTLKDFKEAYFKLISDDKILEVIPHAVFNTPRGNFDLKLQVKTQDQLKLSIGGNISSSTSNEAYFGLSYQNLNEYAQTVYLDAQFGRMYNGLGFGTRIEVPSQKNWYMKLAVVLHKFDYFEGSRLFYEDNRTSYFNQYEGYSKLSIGFPLTMKGLLEFGVGYGSMIDNYTQSISLTHTNKSDKSIFWLGSLFARVENYTLNNLMYPTRGSNYSALFQLIGGEETFKSAANSNLDVAERMDLWGQFKGIYDRYIPISKKLTLGTYAELMFSNRNLLQNYTVSLIQAPAFQPTPHSKSIFNDAFHANQFGAIGLKPIYHINNQLHLRTEAYWFLPYKTIIPGTDNLPQYSAPFSSSQFLAEGTLVANFKIASAGLFLNYYSSGVSQWNFGLNIGFLLFNSKFTE